MRLDTWNKQQIQKRAGEFFLRLQHTNPFPVTVDDVVPGITDPIYNTYVSCMPKHIRDAVLLLIANKPYIHIFDTNTSSTLAVTIPHPAGVDSTKHCDTSIEFTFSGRYPSWTRFNREAKLDPEHPKYDEIVQWAYKAQKISQECLRCHAYICSVVDWANTAGQLRTMFPDYVRMLPEHQQRHISKMQKRSRLPEDIDMDYLNEYRSFVADKIALCLLLPEGEEKIWLG